MFLKLFKEVFPRFSGCYRVDGNKNLNYKSGWNGFGMFGYGTAFGGYPVLFASGEVIWVEYKLNKS